MRAAAFLAFIVLAQAAFAFPSEIEPALVGTINFTLAESGTLEAVGGSMSYLEINVSVPGNFSYQSVSYGGRLVRDSDGNELANIRVPNPPNPYTFSILSNGTSAERITRSLPASYSVPDAYAKYVLGTGSIQSTDPAIREAASAAVGNSTDDWERVVKLAEFVNSHLSYDDSVKGQEHDARWALDNRRGVCVEYARLYAAMARSQGIPTRVVSGYAFSQAGEWLGHAWAESYIGEWVPVDPTWLEAGHIDGTHIQLAAADDVYTEARAAALITQGADLVLSLSDRPGGAAQGVQVSGVTQNPPLQGVQLGAGAQRIPIGGETVVYAKVASSDYRLLKLTLTPCSSQSGEPAQIIDGDTRVLALRPGMEETAYWHIKSNPALGQGYEWTCPIALNSPYLGVPEMSLVFEPGAPLPARPRVWAARGTVLLGEAQTVYYDTGSSGARIGFATDAGIFDMGFSPGLRSFNFTPRTLGANRILAFTNSGAVAEMSFTVAPEAAMRINAVAAPLVAIQGKPVSFSVIVENLRQNSESVLVKASLAGGSAESRASVAGTYSINLTLTPEQAGQGNLSVTIEGNGFSDQVTVPVEAKPQPQVTISNVSFAFVGSRTTVIIHLAGSGEPLLLNASIGGAKTPAQLGEVSLEAGPGGQALELEWLDAAGNRYSSSTQVEVPAAPPPPTPTPVPTPAPGGLCPSGFALAAAPLIAIFLTRRLKCL